MRPTIITVPTFYMEVDNEIDITASAKRASALSAPHLTWLPFIVSYIHYTSLGCSGGSPTLSYFNVTALFLWYNRSNEGKEAGDIPVDEEFVRQASTLGRDLLKSAYKRGFFRGAIGGGLGLVALWAVLLKFVSGWWVLAVNIGFFIATIIVIGWASITFFRLYLRTWLAILISAGIYVGLVVGVRSAILTALGV